MSDELRIYNESRTTVILLIIVAILLLFQAFRTFLFINNIDSVEIFFAVFGSILAIICFFYIIYLMIYPTIVTSKNIIIYNPGPLMKAIKIDLSKIEKIKETSFSNILIWYRDDNDILFKQKIGIPRLTWKHQVEFHKFINKIQKTKESQAI